METLTNRSEVEHSRSFDPLASVRMLQYDIQRSGMVLPETRQRVCDEELSYLSEAVDRSARTSFVLQRQGEDIMYFAKGAWRPYQGTLLTGLEVAKKEAAQDPRRQFLYDRAVDDYKQGLRIRALQPGQKLSWYSPFPEEEARMFGDAFVQSCGFNSERRLGFIYQATCMANGSVLLESQTIDNSDESAFVNVMQVAEQYPEADMPLLITAYDEVMNRKYRGEFYAGRLGGDEGEDIWEKIKAQKDLVVYLLDGLEKIAWLKLPLQELERHAKEHVYGVWATFKKRLDGTPKLLYINQYGIQLDSQATIAMEVQQNFREFVREGKPMIGCGGEIKMLQGYDNVMNAESSEVFDSIFGRSEEDKFGPLEFQCKHGHWNKRPRGKLISECRVKSCKKSVSC